MFTGGNAATRAASAMLPGSQNSSADTPKPSMLEALAAHFQSQKLSPPHPGVALRPVRRLSSSTEVDFLAEEEEAEDYVLQTLRAAPLSCLREPTSSSGAVLPARLAHLQLHPPSAKDTPAKSVAGQSPSSHSADALPSLTKVLSLLSCVFQRAPAAYGTSSSYSKLLHLLLDHDFAAHAVDDMEELWHRCGDGRWSTPFQGIECAEAFTTLALYSDVLLLVAYHVTLVERGDALATRAASGSSATASPAPRSFISSPSLVKLYALNQAMGAALADATTPPPPALLRRSVASLTAFLIHSAPRLPAEVAEAALRDLEAGASGASAARSNMAHMAFIAALPTVCPTMSEAWQCRALDVVRQATLYDVDVQVAYCADAGATVVWKIAAMEFGSAIRGLLSIMSEVAWCFCTADTLVHICHAIGMYGGNWETYPESYVNLVNFLHSALLRQRAAYERETSTASHSYAMVASPPMAGDVSSIVQMNQQGGRLTGPRLPGRSVESLVHGAVLGVAGESKNPLSEHQLAHLQPRTGRGDDEQQQSRDLRKVPSFEEEVATESQRSKAEPIDYLIRCEADISSPRSFFFYLSLLAYVTSALPPLLTSFDELPLFFTLSANDANSTVDTDDNNEGRSLASSSANVPLFALCVDLLRANLSTAVGSSGSNSSSSGLDHTSPSEKQRRLLCEATVCLLSAFMTELPHSIQRLERETGTRQLVHAVRDVVTTILSGPSASFQMRRAAYALLYRYGSAVESIGAVMARLMSPADWTALSGDSEYVQADFCERVELFKYLCTHDEEAGAAETGFAMAALAELPAGAFRCVVNGAALATVAVHAVFDLREESFADERALFAAVTLPQLPALVSRLSEAFDALMHAHRSGCWMAGGKSTLESAYVAGWLVHKTTSVYRVLAVVGAATFPVPMTRDEEYDNATVSGAVRAGAPRRHPRNVLEMCLSVLCDHEYSPAHREMAELLAATMQASAEHHSSQQTFQAFRSALSSSATEKLRERLLAVQRAEVGTVSNVLRLEVWLAMVRWCPELFVFLFGPKKQSDDEDDDGSDRERSGGKHGKAEDLTKEGRSSEGSAKTSDVQPEELPFAKVLVASLRATEASLHEKGLALQVLRQTELFAAISVKDVAALLLKTGGAGGRSAHTESPGAQPSASREATASDDGEVALFASACLTYINAILAGQLTRAKCTTTDSAVDSSRNGERTGPLGAELRTPQRRPNLAPLSPPANSSTSPLIGARCKVLATYSDTIDQLLRHAQSILVQCRVTYERESREVSYEDVFEWSARHNAADMSNHAEDISASVVLPQRSDLWRSAVGRSGGRMHSTTWSSGAGDGGVLTCRRTPSALETAPLRASFAQASNASTPLLSITGTQLARLLPYQRLIPVGPAETRFFRGTGDDARLNTLATLLDTAAGLATAVEQLLWFSGVDVNAAGLFSKRTQSLLECAINAVVASRPSSPLLAPLLTRHVQHALRLAKAATGVLESSIGSETVELDVTPAIQRAMLRLAAFVKVNRQHTFLFVDAVPIVTAFPLTSLTEQAAVEALMRDVQAMLHDQLAGPLEDEAFNVFDTAVEGCKRYFCRQRADGDVVVDVVLVSRLLPTLLQYASLLARYITPTQPACASAHRFAGVLECISCILVHVGSQMAVLGFVSKEVLLGFTRALGQFALSSVFDGATHYHHRLGWHVCWHAVLSLWTIIASLRGPCGAKAAGWLPSLTAALESVPRFASAIGAFPGAHGADRQELLVWEVEEVDVATRLAAVLAINDVSLSSLLTSVQAGFLFMQQPRLQKRCVASVPTAEASVSEGRRIVAAQAYALRNALTVLLKQPPYALPRDGASLAAFVFSPELLGGLVLKASAAAEGTEHAGDGPRSLVASLDVLRQFTVRELQVLRRLTASTAQDRSPDVGRSSTGSAVSRESSVTRSPSRGPLADCETVTEGDELNTADGVATEDSADQQAAHLEAVQLALSAYTLTVEDYINGAPAAPGGFYTSTMVQSIRHTTERLLHTLDKLAHEVRDLRRPLLSHIVKTKTEQLTAVLQRL